MAGPIRARPRSGLVSPPGAQTAPPEAKGAGWGRRLNLLDSQSLAEVIDRAVSEALRLHMGQVEAGVRARVRAESVRRFRHHIKQRGRTVRGMPKQGFLDELGEQRDKVIVERDQASAQLQGLKRKVEIFREALNEEERRFERSLESFTAAQDQMLRQRLRELFAASERDGSALPDLRREVVALAVHVLQDDRRQILDGKQNQFDRQAEIYERRIEKLGALVAERDAEIERIASFRPAASGGLRSGYRGVQGLERDSRNLGPKMLFLTRVFQANLALHSSFRAREQAADEGL